MTAPLLYWDWLSQEHDLFCNVLLPWHVSLQDKIKTGEPIALVVPQAMGGIREVIDDLRPHIEEDVFLTCDLTCDPLENLTSLYADELNSILRAGSLEWFEDSLIRLRDDDPGRVAEGVVFFSDDEMPWEIIETFLDAQKTLAFQAFFPLVVCRTAPTSSRWRVVRFGAPRPMGSLQHFPTTDLSSLSVRKLYLRFVVSWEAASLPKLGHELFELLDKELPRWDDHHFDKNLHLKLSRYAVQCSLGNLAIESMAALSTLARGSLISDIGTIRDDMNELWHQGVVVWEGDRFDITPLAARALLDKLKSPDDRAALARRRTGNPFLARWLSAWASTVEEYLRLLIHAHGETRFTKHLEISLPIKGEFKSRLDELKWQHGRYAEEEKLSSVALADVRDMTDYLNTFPQYSRLKQVFERWRQARNRIIHEGASGKKDFQGVAEAIGKLNQVLDRA